MLVLNNGAPLVGKLHHEVCRSNRGSTVKCEWGRDSCSSCWLEIREITENGGQISALSSQTLSKEITSFVRTSWLFKSSLINNILFNYAKYRIELRKLLVICHLVLFPSHEVFLFGCSSFPHLIHWIQRFGHEKLVMMLIEKT